MKHKITSDQQGANLLAKMIEGLEDVSVYFTATNDNYYYAEVYVCGYSEDEYSGTDRIGSCDIISYISITDAYVEDSAKEETRSIIDLLKNELESLNPNIKIF